IVASIFSVTLFIGIYFAYSPKVRRQVIEVKNESLAGQKLRISLGSDFHLGLVMRNGQLAKFVKMSNAEKPDLVLLAGDLVDDIPYWYEKFNMDKTMRKLESNHGVYGILGNHEYYGKKVDETIALMESSSIKMLVDETIVIPNVCALTGREDLTNKGRKKLEDLRVETTLPWFIMDHTPHDIETPANLGANLQVSGHTHRGQMWPNQLITRKVFPLDYGYKKIQELHAITTSGFGFWGPPVRTNSRAELWIIDIKYTKD
ncbi:MAG: metallophosphoesterase, partial [Kurthia sp.]